MTKQYKSDALAAAHETAMGLTEAGVMAKRTMKVFDETCLMPVEEMAPERSREIRPGRRRALDVRGRPGTTSPRERRINSERALGDDKDTKGIRTHNVAASSLRSPTGVNCDPYVVLAQLAAENCPKEPE